MKRLLPFLVLSACAAGTAQAQKPAPSKAERVVLSKPLPAHFDLANHDAKRAEPVKRMQPVDASRYPDIIEMPAVEMELGQDGPVFSAGAFGSKRKCRPKLAHVCVDWRF